MTVDEIMERFHQTPSQKKMDELRVEARKLRDIARSLSQKASNLEAKAGRLTDAANREGDTVANKLDKEFPDWRMVLVNNYPKKPEGK